jgi:hypothetical protein
VDGLARFRLPEYLAVQFIRHQNSSQSCLNPAANLPPFALNRNRAGTKKKRRRSSPAASCP